jgi:hypothetical protein
MEIGLQKKKSKAKQTCLLTALTHKQFRDILLTLCMGRHPRLGKHSSLLPLTSDILRLACARPCASQLEKHIVFHTQEQWIN